MKKTKVIRLNLELAERLREEAQKIGISLSALVNHILFEYAEKKAATNTNTTN